MSIPLHYILSQGRASSTLYLPLTDDGLPIVLGEGKFAKVFLGTTVAPDTPPQPAQLIALKFLKRDIKSPAVSRNSLFRFCAEVHQTARVSALAQGTVIPYHGYGRVGPLPPRKTDDGLVFGTAFDYDFDNPKTLHSVFGRQERSTLDEKFQSNSLAGSKLNQELFTGDFCALQLGLMTVEEFLLQRGNPAQNLKDNVLKRAQCPLLPALEAQARPFAHQLHEDANAWEDLILYSEQTGLEDADKLRDRVLFVLAKQILSAVAGLHQAKDLSLISGIRGELEAAAHLTGIAHRDIKPANLLLPIDDQGKILLSDFGFIAPVTEISRGGYTRISSLDEGGVLPLGSKGYRSPEQIDSGEEISFNVAKEGDGRILEVFGSFDSGVRPGDWLYLHGEFEGPAGRTPCARVTRVNSEDPGRARLELPYPVLDPSGLMRGRVVRDVSLHSDLYSVGCIVYMLGSEGRDPEKFMRLFVDEFERDRVRVSIDPWVVDDPLFYAMALCQAPPKQQDADFAVIAEQLRRSVDMRSSQLRAGEAPIEDSIQATVSQLQDFNANLFRRDVGRIRAHRNRIGKSALLKPLLLGKHSQKPISLPQLYLTLACCMRGGAGSFLPAGADLIDETGAAKAVYARAAHTFSSTIKWLADDVLSKCPSIQVAGDSQERFVHTRLTAGRIPRPTKVPAERPDSTILPSTGLAGSLDPSVV